MKSLKIKKFLKIFSVIICSIFIFSNNVEAEEFKANNKTFNTNELDNILTEEYSSLNLEEYVYKYAFVNDNKMYYVLDNNFQGYEIDTSNWVNEKSTSYLKSDEYVRTLSYSTSGFLFSDVYAYVYDFSNNSYELSNPNWNKRYIVGSYDSNNMTREQLIEWHKERFVYANTNITTQYNANNEKLNFYISYEEFEIKENPIQYRMQFNNDVSPDLKQITFDFPKIALENNLKARIEFGNWNNIIEEIPKFNSLKIVGYDLNNNQYDLSNDIGYGYETTDYLTSKQLDFSFILNSWANIPEEVIRIKIYFDFDTFNNNYYFNVFDNFIDGTTFWDYVENFLVDYKKYEFKENYDIAIIRSKNYQNIDSFYISDKIYFTSTEYNFNLKVYDFNNKLEKYNFTSLTQYLINDVYLKIPLEIDEENNVFPILTKSKEKENGTFYLKNDLFVQWYDSETGNILIENESEENFNNNNDLNISNEDKENIKPIEQDNQNSIYVFFNNFWKMFEKFGDTFNYITSCFSAWYFQLPETIQFFLCISFAFIIYKMLASFVL